MENARGGAGQTNAEIDEAIAERIRQWDVGAGLARRGVTAVALDEQGRIVEHRPDGTTRLIETADTTPASDASTLDGKRNA